MTDNLRRNPSFFNEPRDDCVMYAGANHTIIFARLLYIFKCSINNDKGPYSLALVQIYDEHIDRPASDEYLGMIRVRAKRRKEGQFIFVDSIIRGAMLVSANEKENPNDCFVVDTVDTDMFLRLRHWAPNN